MLPSREDVSRLLELKLKEMAQNDELPDVITFAGNGEPTMHPQFSLIIEDTMKLRDQFAADARIAVLSNSTMLFKSSVVEALNKIDDNILKLDSAFPATIEIMNCPVGRFYLDDLIKQLQSFQGNLIIQTMFLKGTFKGVDFDNTTDKEVNAWIELLAKINPKKVMIYSIARDTPLQTLIQIIPDKLHEIAARARQSIAGIIEVSA